MNKKYKKIISYFRKCADAEDSKAFRIPKDKNSIFYVTPYKTEIKKILFGDGPFFTVSGQPEFTGFFEHWKINKKNSHIFLAIDIIKKREKTGISLLPLYMVEMFIEKIEKFHGQEGASSADIFRISIADNEPWFNRSLLDSSLSVPDQFLLLDEIKEEPDWISKRNLFLNYLNKESAHNRITDPLLFISNLQVVQSVVSRELDWIERRYLEKIPDTALSLIFDRVSNSSPQYEKPRYLEIFPMDKIQRDVVQFALNNPFTSITGPPGTGKSQVVLNLLANIYINHKTVLFASKNNKAVNTVIEKLESVQNGFCPFARLGNKNEKDKGLQKILSGLYRGVSAKEEIFYEELMGHSESINFLYKKLENSQNIFDSYCSSMTSLSSKAKDIPSRIQKLIFEGLFETIDHYESVCLRLKKRLNKSNRKFSTHKKTLAKLEEYLNELEAQLVILEDNIRPFYLLGSTDEMHLPDIGLDTLKGISEFIEKIEIQKTVNEEIEIEEKNKEQVKQENDREELEIVFEVFVADHFDQELRLLIEENFDEVTDKINSSYFEINKLKAEIEKFLQRKESLIGSAFVSVCNPRFERKSYKRFEKFLSVQPDIVSKFAVTQTCDLNITNLYKVIKILSRIPEFINFLKNLKYKSEKINKIQIQKGDLLRKIELLNFLWIKDGIVKFSEMLHCPLPSDKPCSHLDFINHWLENAKYLRNLIEHIIAYKEVRSKIDKGKIEIEKLVPRTKLQYYNALFNEVDTGALPVSQ